MPSLPPGAARGEYTPDDKRPSLRFQPTATDMNQSCIRSTKETLDAKKPQTLDTKSHL